MAKIDKATEILDIAERMARQGGYGGFSFREIAKEAGVKSASVHYHFPTKEDLGIALANRYTEQFLESLGNPSDFASPQDALEHYHNHFRKALTEDGLMCLCGMLGTQYLVLPDALRRETRLFFERNIDWLEGVYERAGEPATPQARREAAVKLIATLEGAMILAQTLDDNAYFESAIAKLTG
ncbi:MAG: TetR/AcrR family transcriptional regulator [Pseudomonadota bacterium]